MARAVVHVNTASPVSRTAIRRKRTRKIIGASSFCAAALMDGVVHGIISVASVDATRSLVRGTGPVERGFKITPNRKFNKPRASI